MVEVKKNSRLEALKEFQSKLNKDKRFGENAIVIGNEVDVSGVKVIPTGSMQLDEALGAGGFPKGRIVEVYGPESSGKTTLAISVAAQAQKAGGNVGFVDVEHALDSAYAKKLGLDLDAVAISQPDNAEQALALVEEMVDSRLFDVIVLDSVAALAPKAEIEGEMGQSHVGIQARLMSQALRKLTAKVGEAGVCLIFINQIRMKIGVMYGDPTVTSGGNALKFYASVRLEARKGETLKDGESIIGHSLNVKVVKNKIGSPGKKVEIPLMYGEGIDRVGEVYALAEAYEVFTKGGGTHYLGGDKTQKMASSKDEMLQKLRADKALLKKFEQLIMEKKKK